MKTKSRSQLGHVLPVLFVPDVTEMMKELEVWSEAVNGLTSDCALAAQPVRRVEAPCAGLDFLSVVSEFVDHDGMEVDLGPGLRPQDEPCGKPGFDRRVIGMPPNGN